MKSVPSDKHFWYSSDEPPASTCKRYKCHVILAVSVFLLTTSALIALTICTFNKIKQLEEDINNLAVALKALKELTDDEQYNDINNYREELQKVDDDVAADKILPDAINLNTDYYYYDYDNENISDVGEMDDAFIAADKYTKDYRKKRSIADNIPSNLEGDEQERNKTSRILQAISTDPPSVQSDENLWRPITPFPARVNFDNPPTRKNLRQYRYPFATRAKSDQQSSAESVEFRVERDEHRRRNVEGFEPQPRVGRMRPLPTVHYSGDTSRYGSQHSNYRGNGHLRHLQQTFIDWKESDWVRNLGMDQHFEMDDGKLTIKETGLYFVYAQIYYLDVYDSNGFIVKKNSETMLQCTVTFHSRERDYVGNTCYTAGAEYLMEGDVISLRDLSEGRYTIFSAARSFFGVIKLGDIRM